MIPLAPWGADVIKTLQQAGFLAYAVGGCVRDSLMGKQPKDYDVATNARPHQVTALFPKTYETGLAHGTVTVLSQGNPVEVTTFRREGKYSDFRRPDEVLFTHDPKEDAARRDFTVNALYWDGQGQLLDFYGGLDDLNRRILLTVGDGKQRFSEDALRILRAARFAAQLGFFVDESVRQAMMETKELLAKISRERIGEEWEKILCCDHPQVGFSILEETGCTHVIDPRIKAGEREWEACASLPKEKPLRWAALLWNSQQVESIVKEMRRDGKTISRVAWLVEHQHDELVNDYSLKRLVADSNIEALRQLLLIRSCYGNQGELTRMERIQEEHGFVTMNTLEIDGKTLKDLGMKPGKELGEAKKWLLEQVLLGHVPNDSEKLTKKLIQKR